MMKKLFIFGVGFSASRTGQLFKSEGFEVSGTIRQSGDFAGGGGFLKQENLVLFNDGKFADPEHLARELQETTHVLISIPPNKNPHTEEDLVFSAIGDRLDTLCPHLEWLGYLSSIVVYGETEGEIVNENAALKTELARGQRRIRAEKLWLEQVSVSHVFRIAGIYGPGRGPLQKIRQGKANRIDLPGNRVFNRIHVDDIALMLLASAKSPSTTGPVIYNLADDEAAPAHEVIAYGCNLLGVDPPPLLKWEDVEPTMSAMAKSFYAESKQVTNKRIKEQLGIELLYPTYREGLRAQLEEEMKLNEIKTTRVVVVLNIGSLRPDPFLDLRQICSQMRKLNSDDSVMIVPASARFSNKIDPNQLENIPAQILSEVFDDLLPKGYEEFVILPVFFGPSATLTTFLPKVIDSFRNVGYCFRVIIAKPLVNREDSFDNRVALILHSRIDEVLEKSQEDNTFILLLDHGTPTVGVNEAREHVATQLRLILNNTKVETACMERREGSEYDFNGPLLADALDFYNVHTGLVIVSLMFLSSGRHAGSGGDIENIIKELKVRHPNVELVITQPLLSHSLLSDILLDRYNQAITL